MASKWLLSTALIALTGFSATPSQAVPMQAVFTVTLDQVQDELGLFAEAAPKAGDTGTATFLFDPDLAADGWRLTTSDTNYAYGGKRYENEYFPSIPSPVTSAALTIGSVTVSLDTSYFGYVYLQARQQSDGTYLTNLGFTGSENDNLSLIAASYFITNTPSPLSMVSLETSYDFDLPNLYNGSLGHLRSYMPEIGQTSLTFVPTHLTMAPVETPPPAPVPLPASAPLILSGLAAFAGLRKLTRRAA